MIENPTTPKLNTSITPTNSAYTYSSVDRGLSIVSLEQVGPTAWDEFVEHSEGSLPNQVSVWETILHKTYGYSCHFLAAQKDGKIQGILPLYRVTSPLTGDSLQSMSGAVCAATPQAAQALLTAADDLAKQLDIDYLLLRDSRQLWDACGLDVLEAHRGVRLHLPADRETAWKNLHRDLRYDIRYGTRKGEIDIIVDRPQVDDFYKVLLQGSHQMGTPLFSKQFVLNVVQGFSRYFSTSLAYWENKPIAGYFNLNYRNISFGLWGISLRSYLYLRPTHRVFWQMIEQQISQGLNLFDMGRSAYPSTQYNFKENWGDETYPIYQLFHIYRGKTPPTLNIHMAIQKNRQVSLFNRVWSKLPLTLAQSLGPIVRRHVPFG